MPGSLSMVGSVLSYELFADEVFAVCDCAFAAETQRDEIEMTDDILASRPLHRTQKGRITRTDVGGCGLRQKAPECQQEQNGKPQGRDHTDHNAQDEEQ